MRVLVTVASRHGATAEIGSAVGRVLAEGGHDVVEAAPQDVESLDGFDVVVLGSAVYTAHWLPAAREFASRWQPELRRRQAWLFSSGLATQPAASANSPHELRTLAERVGAVGHRSFAGRLQRSELAFAERAMIAGARAKEGDHRDFAAVAAWAREIVARLSQTPAESRV